MLISLRNVATSAARRCFPTLVAAPLTQGGDVTMNFENLDSTLARPESAREAARPNFNLGETSLSTLSQAVNSRAASDSTMAQFPDASSLLAGFGAQSSPRADRAPAPNAQEPPKVEQSDPDRAAERYPWRQYTPEGIAGRQSRGGDNTSTSDGPSKLLPRLQMESWPRNPYRPPGFPYSPECPEQPAS